MNSNKILRHINAIRCLRLLQDGRMLSRADIARDLGLTRATIGYAIDVLIEGGYVLEGEIPLEEGRKGRRGVGVSLDPAGAYFVGVDIGTRVLTAVVLDLRMNVVSRIVEPTGPRYREAPYILDRLMVLVKRVIAEAGVSEDKIDGLCVSVPGLVGRDGSVVNAPFLEWYNYPLRELLIARSNPEWTVIVSNDAKAFANAEAAALATSGTGSVLLVLLAEGIGGAVIDSGKTLAGSHGYTGEIGHTVITVRERTDTFEMLAGAKSFATLLDPMKTVAEGVEAMLGSADHSDVEQALAFWAEALATGFANTIHLLDPGQIVLGGPMASLFPRVKGKVEDMLREKLMRGFSPPSITVARFGPDGAAIGAGATIREAIFSLPELDKSLVAQQA